MGYSGTSLNNKSSFDFIVYASGSKVIAENKSGVKIATGVLSTDDASVIQSALDAMTANRTRYEKLILLGDFTITASITLADYTEIDIQGSLTRSGNGFYLVNCNAVDHIVIKNGVINSAAKSPEAYDTNEIQIDGCTNVLVENVLINDAGEDAIRIQGASSDVKVNKCSFINPNRHAIDIGGTSVHNIIISNNYVNGVLVYDAITVYVDGGHTISIIGNTLENVSGSASSSAAIQIEDIGTTNKSNISVIGNSIYNCKYGIGIASQARPVTVSGNVVRKCVKCIFLQNSTSTIVSGNIFDNSEQTSTSYCVYLYGLTSSLISNNTMKGSTTDNVVYGIYHDASGSYSENTISGNVITSCLYAIYRVGTKNLFLNNVFRSGRQSAVYIQVGAQYVRIENNSFINNGQSANATYQDIEVDASAGNNTVSITIIGNLFRSDATNKVIYNIKYLDANTNNFVVAFNRFSGATSAVFNGSNPNTPYKVMYNLGYTTENNVNGSSLALDTTTEQTLTFTHGLSYTPDVKDCVIQLTTPSNAVTDFVIAYIYIVSTTSSQVTAKAKLSTASVTAGAVMATVLKVTRT